LQPDLARSAASSSSSCDPAAVDEAVDVEHAGDRFHVKAESRSAAIAFLDEGVFAPLAGWARTHRQQ
jgi:hypothetical protein